MSEALERLQKVLKGLPGLGYRSAERVALHLLLEKPEAATELAEALQRAQKAVQRCKRCGNLAEGELCSICLDTRRDDSLLCVVERIPDLLAMERAGSFRGRYHVLHGRLSPVHGIGPDELNLDTLADRIADPAVGEIVLALSNDMEGEATCHFLRQEILERTGKKITRIGFGLPSGGGLHFADSTTLQAALDARRTF